MFKKCSILVGLIVLCIILSCSSVLAMDFNSLPSGITDVVPNGYNVVQTGETDSGIIYVVSAKIRDVAFIYNSTSYVTKYNNDTFFYDINIVGYDTVSGSIAYNVNYRQAPYVNKISSGSKNYFYILQSNTDIPLTSPYNMTTTSFSYAGIGKVKKIDLNTGKIVSTLAGNIDINIQAALNTVNTTNVYMPYWYYYSYYGNWQTYNWGQVSSYSSSGYNVFTIINSMLASSNTVKYIAVSDTDKVYILARESVNNNNRILQWDGSQWARVTQTTFPGSDGNASPSAFCAPTDNIWYTAIGTNVYKTENSIHTLISSYSPALSNGKAIYLFPGINKGVVYVCGDGNGKYLYYYNYISSSSGTFTKVISSSSIAAFQTSNDLNNVAVSTSSTYPTFPQITQITSNYNMVYLPNISNKVCFSYWGDVNSNYGYYNSSYSSIFNIILINNDGSYSNVYGPTLSCSAANNNNYYYNTLGGFGSKASDAYIIYKQRYTNNNYLVFSKLCPILPAYGNITNNLSGGGSTSSIPGYALTVIKDCAFKEVIPDDVLGTSASPAGSVTFTRKSVTSGSTTLYYTVASGTLSDADIDAATSTKGIIVNGKLVVFNVVNPPSTSAQTATLQFN